MTINLVGESYVVHGTFSFPLTGTANDGRSASVMQEDAGGPKLILYDPAGGVMSKTLLAVHTGGALNINNPSFVTALPDGGWVVVGFFTNNHAGFDIFNADGTPRLAGPVETFNRAYQANPGIAIAMQNGGFAVVWNENTEADVTYTPTTSPNGGGSSSSSFDMFAQTFTAQGVPTHAPVIVNDTPVTVSDGVTGYGWNGRSGAQYLGDVDLTANGDLAVTYLGHRFLQGGQAITYANFRVLDKTSLANKVGETPYIQTALTSSSVDAPFNQNFYEQTVVLSNGLLAGIFVNSPGPATGTDPNSGVLSLQLRTAAGAAVGPTVGLMRTARGNSDTNIQYRAEPDGSGGFYLVFTGYPAGSTDSFRDDPANRDLFLNHYDQNGVQLSSQQITNDHGQFIVLQSFTHGADGSFTVGYYRNGPGNSGTTNVLHFFDSGPNDAVHQLDSTNSTVSYGSQNDYAYGLAGDDNISGGAGTDHLFGGAGNDTLTGGANADILWGGTGADTFKYTAASDSTAGGADWIYDFVPGTDKIDLTSVSPTAISVIETNGNSSIFVNTPGGAMLIGVGTLVDGRDIVAGSVGVVIQGDSASTTITGSVNNDTLFGSGGDDTLVGGPGADILFGGSGSDTFLYRGVAASTAASADLIADFVSGSDKIDLSLVTPTAVAVIQAGGNSIVFANTPGGAMQIGALGLVQGSDLIIGNIGVTIQGGADSTIVTGSSFNDTLFGEGGNDVLVGGAGTDVLFGGAGFDVFKYSAPADSNAAGPDLIADFQTNIDKIDLRGTGVTAVGIANNIVFGSGPGGIAMQIGVLGPVALTDILFGASPAPSESIAEPTGLVHGHHDLGALLV